MQGSEGADRCQYQADRPLSCFWLSGRIDHQAQHASEPAHGRGPEPPEACCACSQEETRRSR